MGKHHVIYIPGIGDQRPWGQDRFIRLWLLFGIKVYYHQIGWATNEPLQTKLKKITDQINYLTSQGFLVSLVGVSAGASAALNAYVDNQDKIYKIVFICGKVHYPKPINPRYFAENPAFEESLALSNKNSQNLSEQDKSKMLYFYGIFDTTVPPSTNRLNGVKSKAVLSIGHIAAIYIAIIFYSRSICRFITQAGQDSTDSQKGVI